MSWNKLPVEIKLYIFEIKDAHWKWWIFNRLNLTRELHELYDFYYDGVFFGFTRDTNPYVGSLYRKDIKEPFLFKIKRHVFRENCFCEECVPGTRAAMALMEYLSEPYIQ